MKSRLWYPQLDVFDAARRLGVLLHFFESPPGLERLFISDFFLANPPLLHRTTMPSETRKLFSDLRIPRPEKSFVSYPSAQLLFHKMETIQKEALNALTGKDIVSYEKLKLGFIELTQNGKNLFPPETMSTTQESELCYFLAREFSRKQEEGNQELRRRSGLRRPI